MLEYLLALGLIDGASDALVDSPEPVVIGDTSVSQSFAIDSGQSMFGRRRKKHSVADVRKALLRDLRDKRALDKLIALLERQAAQDLKPKQVLRSK